MNNIIPPDSRPEKPSRMWAVDSLPSFLVANAQQIRRFRTVGRQAGSNSFASLSCMVPPQATLSKLFDRAPGIAESIFRGKDENSPARFKILQFCDTGFPVFSATANNPVSGYK